MLPNEPWKVSRVIGYTNAPLVKTSSVRPE
jgi:hypothetical protein